MPAANPQFYDCSNEQAPKILSWLRTRGGLSIWSSVNLSNPGASWTTPRNTAEGVPITKPNWQCGNEPRVITDPALVRVYVPKAVKTVRVKIRMGTQGFTLKLTDGSSARLRRAVEQADHAEIEAGREPSAFYRFGAGDDNTSKSINGLTTGEDIATIYVNDGNPVPILDWEKAQTKCQPTTTSA